MCGFRKIQILCKMIQNFNYLLWRLRTQPSEVSLLGNFQRQLLVKEQFPSLCQQKMIALLIFKSEGTIYEIFSNLPSSLLHLLLIRSRAYVSPVMMYFPVSPVAPPKITTFDFDTKTSHNVSNAKKAGVFTLSDCVAESG